MRWIQGQFYAPHPSLTTALNQLNKLAGKAATSLERFLQSSQKKLCTGFFMGSMAKLQQGRQHSHLSLLTGDGNAAIFVVLDRRASLLDQCAMACGCEEGWNPSTPCSDPLCKSTLWTDFNPGTQGDRLRDE